MKDEIRSRQSWFGVKKTDSSSKSKAAADSTETTIINTADDARKAVFEVIMSIDSMHDDSGYSPSDDSPEHLEHLELLEMKASLKKSVSKLPDNLRDVIEMRFFKNMGGNEVAAKLGVTPSRVSHMISEAVKKLRIFMVAEGYKDN